MLGGPTRPVPEACTTWPSSARTLGSQTCEHASPGADSMTPPPPVTGGCILPQGACKGLHDVISDPGGCRGPRRPSQESQGLSVAAVGDPSFMLTMQVAMSAKTVLKRPGGQRAPGWLFQRRHLVELKSKLQSGLIMLVGMAPPPTWHTQDTDMPVGQLHFCLHDVINAVHGRGVSGLKSF